MSEWKIVALGDVATIERSSVQPGRILAGTTYVGLEHIESGGAFLNPKPVGAGVLESSKFKFTERHVLYGKLRPYLAKIGCPDFSGICSTDILPILAGPKIERRFLFHFLRQPDMVGYANSRAVGVNLPRLSPSVLAKIPISLPPLPEQRRIAEVLDRADALRVQRRAALTRLDNLTQSIFLDQFTKGLDGPAVDLSEKRSGVPKGWSWELLTNVARLATGHTPDRAQDDYWNGDIPWISLTDIRDLDGTVATRTIQNVTALGIENSSSVLLPAGTICFSRTASVGFVTVMGREMATSQDFVNWVCGPRLGPTYLMWALLAARRRLQALSSGSTHKTIYVRVVEQFRVLVPPIALQHEFARRIAAIENLKTKHRASLAKLDALFASLQHSAFRGEL